jgi:putative hydrolase of the HAD superfamily
MRTPRALTLDLDDTLLDGRALEELIRQVCDSLADSHPSLDAHQLKSANAQAWSEYWMMVADDWALGRLDSASFSLEGWRRTLLACGCTDEVVVQEARDLHRTFSRETHRLYEDVPELLDFAMEANLPIALVTNGASDVQREKLEVLGIEDSFVAVVVSGELGAAKPDALPFETAVAALGCDREDVWHVGDNLMMDVVGAQRAGILAVWLNRSGRARPINDPEPDLEVATLSQLLSILRAAVCSKP